MLNSKKILIIRLSAIGDTIHTLPMLHALKKQYPDCEIGWVVESKAKTFVENNPYIDKCFVIDKKRKKLFKIIKQIKKEKYDIALDPQQLFKSGIILGFSGAKKRITLSGGREFSFLFANKIVKSKTKLFDIDYHVIKRNLELCKYLGCEIDEIRFPSPNNKNEEIFNLLPKTKKKIVAISPATTWKNKHLPTDFWVEVLNYLKDKTEIVFTGSIKDEKLIEHIIEKAELKNYTNIVGKTNLLELKDIFSKCDLVITPDSGSAHIAWLSQKPAILTLFTSTSARRTGPFGDEKYISIQSSAFCSPCMKRKCINKKYNEICRKSFNFETIKKYIDFLLQKDL